MGEELTDTEADSKGLEPLRIWYLYREYREVLEYPQNTEGQLYTESPYMFEEYLLRSLMAAWNVR